MHQWVTWSGNNLVSLSANISHSTFCNTEWIGSNLFRILFTFICPIIIFFGLQYRKVLRSDIKSLGSLTTDSTAVFGSWVISISTVMLLVASFDIWFIDKSFKAKQGTDLSAVPSLQRILAFVTLSGDMVRGVLSRIIDLPPEVQLFGGSLSGLRCRPAGDPPIRLWYLSHTSGLLSVVTDFKTMLS